MHEYDLIADWYATERHGPAGIPELESLIARLPAGASVLDVGCGNGIPFTKQILASGCEVVGVDSSPRMLERFEKNCPGTPFICAPIQSADLAGRLFDAAVAWGVLFHLPHDEQGRAIAKIASVLKPGGLFLFTAGDEDGDKEGDPMNGVPFHYWSFSINGYRELLKANGLTLLDVHRDAGQNTYYLGEKRQRHALRGNEEGGHAAAYSLMASKLDAAAVILAPTSWRPLIP
jgi:SAM-dependent methyltransferase